MPKAIKRTITWSIALSITWVVLYVVCNVISGIYGAPDPAGYNHEPLFPEKQNFEIAPAHQCTYDC